MNAKGCCETKRVYRPSVQIFESPDAVELVAEVPGADQSSTELTLENGELTLRARVALGGCGGWYGGTSPAALYGAGGGGAYQNGAGGTG